MTRTRRLTVSIVLNGVLVAVQIGFGLYAHSVGLLADAGHNLTDIGALALSLVAVRMALRPASPARSFGNHRATILAALANAVLIAAVTVLIVVSAVHRLLHPEHVEAGIVVVVAAAGLVVNGIAAVLLTEAFNHVAAARAKFAAHPDALASAAVLVAGLVLLAAPSATWLDPVSSLVVAGIIITQAAGVFRSSVAVLLESTPSDLDLDLLTSTMAGVPGVSDVHDLHVWSLSSEVRLLSAHLVLTGHPTLEEANVVGDRVRHAIGGPFDIAHSTLELECEPCADVDVDPCAMESAPVATSHHHH